MTAALEQDWEWCEKLTISFEGARARVVANSRVHGRGQASKRTESLDVGPASASTRRSPPTR
jgi:hypothetical protein